VPEKPPLPEEFAPTGPKLSRFLIWPAPPIRPRLFPDEARFALRVAVLAGATEFATWVWVSHAISRREALLLAGLRLLRPLWARVGTRLSRMLVASLLMLAAILCGSLFFFPFAAIGIGLPALGDLCASTIADNVTVERRATALAWLDIGQGLGAAFGFALVHTGWNWPLWLGALVVGAIGIPELRDRGTPRSSWPLAAYRHALWTPLAGQLMVLAILCGLLGVRAGPSGLPAILLPLAGMALAARIEPRIPNAIWLPRIAVAFAVSGLLWWPLRPFAMGIMFAAIPAAVARGAGEMERPLVSSLAWSALILGAAVGAVI